MNSEQAMRFRLGVFVLASLMLLAVLATLFGGFPRLLKRHYDYVVRFHEATGVGPGTPVRRSGVRVGEVKSLEVDESTGDVLVHVSVERLHAIRRDEVPKLVYGLLGGETNLDFIRKKPNGVPPDRTPVPPGEELAGLQQVTVSTLLNQGSEVVPTAQEALNDIRKSLQRFDKLAPLMEETIREYRDLGKAARQMTPELTRTNDEAQVTARNWGKLGERLDVLVQTNQEKFIKALENFNDTLTRIGSVFTDENQKNLTATLKNIRVASDNLDAITKNTSEVLKESQVTMRRVNESLVKTDEVLVNLQRATKPMADRSASVMKNLDESTEKLNRTLHEVHGLLRTITQGDGTLKKFLTDPELYNSLSDAACILTRMMPRMDRILRDVEVFADKIARHPESLGIGGAVRPSSGIKEAPTGIPYRFAPPGH